MGTSRLIPRDRHAFVVLLTQPAFLLVSGFAFLIAIGTLTLRYTEQQNQITWSDAFFHATSAVCVTGLSTFEGGAADFTFNGQLVLITLIQIGGLGVMTVTALAMFAAGGSLSFCSHAALQDTFFQSTSVDRLPRAIGRIVMLVLICEVIGAVVLYLTLESDSAGEQLFNAIFLSISAFCNAGFSTNANSLEPYSGNLAVMTTISLLIIAGGLGYSVLFELIDRNVSWIRGRPMRTVRMSLHSRAVLWSSFILTVGGFLLLLITGILQHEAKDAYGYDFWSANGHALFQAITARTAGFSTLDIGTLTVPAILILIPLMFIGGSPGSCAGGVKTTSFLVWITRIQARLHGDENINLLGRQLPPDVVRRAALLIVIAVLWNGTGVMLMCVIEPVGTQIRLEHVLFEQFSALGTVGLSAGITPELSTGSQMWLTVSMFVGRLGPLTMAFVVLTRGRANVSYPQERVMIG